MFLKNKKQTMIERKFQNIIKLKKDERKTSESSLNDLFFDVSFKQIKILSDFDWLSFSTETVAEASDSVVRWSLIFQWLMKQHWFDCI